VNDSPGAALQDIPEQRPVKSSRVSLRTGRVIEVRTDEVEMPDGVATRDVVVHPGAVGIVALDDRGRVLLLQQYRHPVRRLLWEPPAGLLDVAGEAPLAAAQRELYEEAHLEADHWHVLVDLFTSPGMSDEATRVFLARGVRDSARDRHPGEHEEVDMPTRWVDLDEAVAAALDGRIHNPLAVSGLLAARAARDVGWSTLRPAELPFAEMSDFTGSHPQRSAPDTDTGDGPDNGVAAARDGDSAG
jgi:ADP-ribose pyrophosphatase